MLQVRYFDSDGEKVETDQLGDTLEVRNFPASVSKDLVELYFENPKSGGCDGAVKSVSITGPGVAQVRFSSPTSECSEVVIITLYSCILHTVREMGTSVFV